MRCPTLGESCGGCPDCQGIPYDQETADALTTHLDGRGELLEPETADALTTHPDGLAEPLNALPEHSEHGASSCKRWWTCPGSVALTRHMPDETSVHAAEGTAAHALAALCLESGQAAEEWVGRMVDVSPGVRWHVDADMAEAVQVYLDHCRGLLFGTGPAAKVLVEHRFTLADLDPPAPMYGTADHVLEFGAWLFVSDLKYGQGVQVAAEGNPQLRYYALGALLSRPADAPPIRYIRATIVQPRAPGGPAIRSVDLDPVELIEWSVELMDRAAATLEPGAPFVPGEWCKSTFCKARGNCAARAEAAMAVAGLEFVDPDAPVPVLPDPRTITPADKSRLLGLLPLLEDWCKDLRSSASADISSGTDIPGWKLVPTRPSQRWTDPAEAEAALDVLHELGDARFAPRQIVSPAQARGLLAAVLRPAHKTKKSAEEAARAALAPLISTASSGTNLVPDADARPAIPAGGAEFITSDMEPT